MRIGEIKQGRIYRIPGETVRIRTAMPEFDFIRGLELSRGFFADLVEPLLRNAMPDLRYSAGLIGAGSEVLGFDTPMSTDHHWGPRVLLFICPEDFASRGEEIRAYLSRTLPPSYRGYSTNFTPPRSDDPGTQHLAPSDGGFINHRVEVFTAGGFFESYLGIDASAPFPAADWLTLPSQKLLSIVSGRLFRDDLGLETVRRRLSWYPRDVWLYILGCCWARVGQEEHLMGRAGSAEDEIGSALIGARLVRDIMRIAFLLEKEYAPYSKWFGTVFKRLRCASRLQPRLHSALRAADWREREAELSSAYEEVMRLQGTLGITDETHGNVGRFWNRPFLVIHGDTIAEAVFSAIGDRALSTLARNRPIGNIDLISDNTDVLENTSLRPLIRKLYE